MEQLHVPKVHNTVCTLDTHCHTNWQSNMYLRSTIQCVLWIHIVKPTDRATCIQGLQDSEYSGYKLSYQLTEQNVKDLQYSVYSGYTLSYQLTEQHVSKVYNTVCTLDTHCHTNWQSNMYLRSTIQWILGTDIVIPTDRATCILGLQYNVYSGYILSYQLTEQHVSKFYNTVCTLDTHCHTNWQSNMYLRSTIQCVLWIHIVIPTDRATC